MSDGDSGIKWWIRYVLVPLIGGGGIVALLVAYLNRPTPPQTQPPASAASQQSNTPAPTPTQAAATAVDVEKLVSRWLAAWLSGDADGFVASSGEPFFFDKELVLTRADLRARYNALAATKAAVWKKLEVRAIRVQTASELAATGYDLTKDRVFKSMNLSPSDFAVSVQLALDNRIEGMLIVVRRRENSLEVAGTWD